MNVDVEFPSKRPACAKCLVLGHSTNICGTTMVRTWKKVSGNARKMAAADPPPTAPKDSVPGEPTDSHAVPHSFG